MSNNLFADPIYATSVPTESKYLITTKNPRSFFDQYEAERYTVPRNYVSNVYYIFFDKRK